MIDKFVSNTHCKSFHHTFGVTILPSSSGPFSIFDPSPDLIPDKLDIFF